MASVLIRNFLLGFIKLHILHHAQREPIFGQEFKKELARRGYDISFGTLYPIFHKLEKKGWFSCHPFFIYLNYLDTRIFLVLVHPAAVNCKK